MPTAREPNRPDPANLSVGTLVRVHLPVARRGKPSESVAYTTTPVTLTPDGTAFVGVDGFSVLVSFDNVEVLDAIAKDTRSVAERIRSIDEMLLRESLHACRDSDCHCHHVDPGEVRALLTGLADRLSRSEQDEREGGS